MPRRSIDPETGEPNLTWRENKMVDGFISNGGNAARAAVEAGYSPNNPSQAAWKVLHRPAVQDQIRARIEQARIDPGEPIGSLVSQMRADVTDCFGPDGAFSVDLARQNGLGHLLKVSTTIHRKADQDGSLRTVGDATKIEFLSPQAASLQLAKISAVAHPDSQQPQDTDEQRLALLETLVRRTHERYPGTTREQVFKCILDVRPEVARYIPILRQRLADSDETHQREPDSRGAVPSETYAT